jgi:hypothetical protein
MERAERAAHATVPPQGLSTLHALQERLWHWHDMRPHSQGKYAAPGARPANGSARASVGRPRSLFEGASEEECYASPS